MATPQAETTVKKTDRPKSDPAVVTKLSEGWRYVTIPSEDIYEQPFDGIWINARHFAPGTHLVDPDIATSLEDRITTWQKSMVRLMRPGVDKKSVDQATRRGSYNAGAVIGEPAPEAQIG